RQGIAPATITTTVLPLVIHTPQRVIDFAQIEGLWIRRIRASVTPLSDQAHTLEQITRRAVSGPVHLRVLDTQQIHDLFGAKAHVLALGRDNPLGQRIADRMRAMMGGMRLRFQTAGSLLLIACNPFVNTLSG